MENLSKHPTEEELECFLLHHAEEDSFEAVEAHLLACASCVAHLETLEFRITVMKLALQSSEIAPNHTRSERQDSTAKLGDARIFPQTETANASYP